MTVTDEMEAPDVTGVWPLSGERRQGVIRRWRRATVIGGLILAVSFFLPAVDGCNTRITPAVEVWDQVKDDWNRLGINPEDWAGVFVLFVAAYLFGLIASFLAIRALRTREQISRQRSWILHAYVAPLLLVMIVPLAVGLYTSGPGSWDGEIIFFLSILFLSIIYWFRSLGKAAAGALCLRWYLSVCCIAWFSLWLSEPQTYYGLWTSIAGSVLLALSAFMEARTLSRRSFLGTLGGLITCRFVLIDPDEPRCACGYLLLGLTLPRCPECGRAFLWEDFPALRPAKP